MGRPAAGMVWLEPPSAGMAWLEPPAAGAKSVVLEALPYPLLICAELGGGIFCRGREDMVKA